MSDAILSENAVRLAEAAVSRDDAIRAAGAILVESGAVEPAYVDAMLQREESVSTYMGNYLAIPHGTNEAKDAIKRSALCLIRYPEPIDWGGDEVRFVVGIAGLENEHLDMLGKIAVIFSDEDEVAKLLAAGSAEELYGLLGEVNAE